MCSEQRNTCVISVNVWRKVAALAVAGLLFPASAWAVEYDLTVANQYDVAGAVGGTAVIANDFLQPTGTGVFSPFLSLQQANGKVKTEQAYNTNGAPLYMDEDRPAWNKTLTFNQLVTATIDSKSYYAFILDANEPGSDKSLLSIDNIRIYTSATDNTGTVGSDITKLDDLGTLRWALNDPTLTAGVPNITNWVKLDADQNNVGKPSNGGSGMADMVVYVPTTAFTGVSGTDYVWFYNLNGVHYSVDKNLAAEAGFEEWKAVTGPEHQVPDGGSTLLLMGLALTSFGALCSWRARHF